MKRILRIPELTTKAKILLGLVVFVLIGSLAVLIATSIITQQIQSSSDEYNFKDMDAATRKKDAVKAAEAASDSGDSAKAAEIYEQAIEAEPDPAKKVELAIYHSRMLQLADKFDDAVAVAKKAESYSEDKFLITDWLAQLYEQAKRYDEAASYYEKVSTMADSPTNVGKYSKSFYEAEAARMKAKAKNS